MDDCTIWEWSHSNHQHPLLFAPMQGSAVAVLQYSPPRHAPPHHPRHHLSHPPPVSREDRHLPTGFTSMNPCSWQDHAPIAARQGTNCSVSTARELPSSTPGPPLVGRGSSADSSEWPRAVLPFRPGIAERATSIMAAPLPRAARCSLMPATRTASAASLRACDG